jgi:hypothetical protein
MKKGHFQYCKRCRILYDMDAYACPLCKRAPPDVERRTRIMLTLGVIGLGIIAIMSIWKI